MKKKELIFITGILIFSLLLWAGISLMRKDTCSAVRITVNGKVLGIYSLDKNQKITIGETNICEIQNGQARMIEAHCPDQLCIKQKAIGSSGGVIICLPNQVVIEGVNAFGSETGSSEFDTAV